MKILFLIISLSFISCSQKYQNLGTISKKAFIENDEYRDSKKPLRAGKSESESFCAGQILFQKNAYDITQSSLKSLVSSSCPGDEYLQNVKIKRTWWTVLVYSRSCIEVQSSCSK